AGLQHSGGKAILNSANLEEGEDAGKRFDRVMSLAREYGAAVICLAIDEEGQARTADWKLRVCRRIYDLAVERYGIEPTDLIFDRRADGYDPLTELMALFEGVDATAVEQEDRSGWPIEQRLEHRIIDGNRDGLEADLEEQLASRPALSIVNDVLLEGMKVVGDLFASGEMQLPFVLQSAECMKAAVAYLEPHMEKADQGGKGRVVLA